MEKGEKYWYKPQDEFMPQVSTYRWSWDHYLHWTFLANTNWHLTRKRSSLDRLSSRSKSCQLCWDERRITRPNAYLVENNPKLKMTGTIAGMTEYLQSKLSIYRSDIYFSVGASLQPSREQETSHSYSISFLLLQTKHSYRCICLQETCQSLIQLHPSLFFQQDKAIEKYLRAGINILEILAGGWTLAIIIQIVNISRCL